MMDFSKLKIFTGVAPEVIANIIKNSPRELYHMGQVIVMQGDVSNGKGYIIEKGEVVVKIDNQERAILHEGEIFGEIALLNEEKRVASVVAKTDVQLIIISFENLIDIINNDENIINKEIIRRLEENLKGTPEPQIMPTLDDSPDQIKSGFLK